MKRATSLAVVALVLTLAACGGDDDGGGAAGGEPAASEQTTTVSGGAETTTGPDGATGEVAAPPTELPDACSLLTEDEAFALLTPYTEEEYRATFPTWSGLTPALVDDGLDGEPACVYGAGEVVLAVSIIPASADLLEAYHGSLLDTWTGDPLPGVGDGAEIGGSTPVGLDAFDGFWQIALRVYVTGEVGPDEGYPDRFTTAANVVFERLAGG